MAVVNCVRWPAPGQQEEVVSLTSSTGSALSQDPEYRVVTPALRTHVQHLLRYTYPSPLKHFWLHHLCAPQLFSRLLDLAPPRRTISRYVTRGAVSLLISRCLLVGWRWHDWGIWIHRRWNGLPMQKIRICSHASAPTAICWWWLWKATDVLVPGL